MPAQTKPWETLAPGEIWRGHWETGVAGVPLLPVLAARGKHPGPTLLTTGSVHGDEYEGPAAIQMLFRTLNVNHLHGVIIGLPVVNGLAWQARSRTTPQDDADLNRIFSGNTNSHQTPSHHLAELIFDTFVRACELLVDLHSGGIRLVHLPMVGWYQGDSGKAELLARGFGRPLRPWQLGTVPGVLSYEAHRADKIALGAEWGGGGRLDPIGARAFATGLQRILDHLGDNPLSPEELDTRPPLVGAYQQTESGGLFSPTVALGDSVTQNQPLGQIYDELGTLIAEPKTFRTGDIAALAHLPLVYPGDRIAYIG